MPPKMVKNGVEMYVQPTITVNCAYKLMVVSGAEFLMEQESLLTSNWLKIWSIFSQSH